MAFTWALETPEGERKMGQPSITLRRQMFDELKEACLG